MLTILNRRELLVTLSMERQAEVRRILAENGIDYTIKTTNMQGGMQKANMWSAGFNQSFAWEYKIYVHKKDLEYAQHLIRWRNGVRMGQMIDKSGVFIPFQNQGLAVLRTDWAQSRLKGTINRKLTKACIWKSNFQFARERYGERMRILYELSWLWETLVIALAAAAVCVVCAMLICKAVKKNLSKKTAAVIGAAAFAGAVLAVIVIARTPMPLWLNGMLDCLCISTTYDLCVW